jgi:hypothetical protein
MQESDLKDAEERIAINPYDYEAHLTAIASSHSNTARINMAKYFPLDLSLWTDWILDEQHLESKINLYRLALQDYNCISLLTPDIQLHESLINNLINAYTNGNLVSLEDVFTQCKVSLDQVGWHFKEVLVYLTF